MSSAMHMFSKDKSSITAGIELELHDICVVFFQKRNRDKHMHGNFNNSEYEYFRVGGADSIFHLKDVTCTSDMGFLRQAGDSIHEAIKLLQTYNQKYERYPSPSLIFNINNIPMGFPLPNAENSKIQFYLDRMNIFEFSTNPLSSEQDITLAVNRIKIIVSHLVGYIKAHKESGMVIFKSWVENFNATYKDDNDLQIKVDVSDKVEILIITKSFKQNLQSEHLAYYPQFNFSSSLERLGDTSLATLLNKEISLGLASQSDAIKDRVAKKFDILGSSIYSAKQAIEYLKTK